MMWTVNWKGSSVGNFNLLINDSMSLANSAYIEDNPHCESLEFRSWWFIHDLLLIFRPRSFSGVWDLPGFDGLIILIGVWFLNQFLPCSIQVYSATDKVISSSHPKMKEAVQLRGVIPAGCTYYCIALERQTTAKFLYSVAVSFFRRISPLWSRSLDCQTV